jgi:hypothetical protein
LKKKDKARARKLQTALGMLALSETALILCRMSLSFHVPPVESHSIQRSRLLIRPSELFHGSGASRSAFSAARAAWYCAATPGMIAAQMTPSNKLHEA